MIKLKQLQINDLHLGCSQFFIICTLIGRNDARYFIRNPFRTNSETSATSESNKGVQSFVVRDTHAVINCKVWGSSDFISTMNQQFRIGDIISITNPVVSSRNYNEYEPNTSSQFLLTINESRGNIILAAESSFTIDLRICFNKPIKPTSAAMRLSDISSRGTRSNGELFDLLVVVQRLRPTRQFQGERKGCFRDAIVMDASFHGMKLTIWNGSYVERSEKWQEMTVLQLIDVRAMYSTYSKMVELSTNSRTLIVEHPDSAEARSLKTFAQNAPMTTYNVADDTSETVDLASITTVMTCQQILDRIEADIIGSEDHFTAVIFAVVTVYDLDGCSLVFTRRCNICRNTINSSAVYCNNDDCMIQTSSFEKDYRATDFSDSYNIRMSLTDFTESLDNCRMYGATAERILGKSLGEFRNNLTDLDRSKLKWILLLERCKLKVIIKRKTAVRQAVSITVLDCVVADTREVLTDIKAY